MKNPEETQSILVPVDFTEITPNTLEHACALAALFNKPITLLHVVHKGFLEADSSVLREEAEALAKLENLSEKVFSENGIICKAIVRRGSIFDEIGEAARDINATLVVMGTHGVKGLQHVFGSRAIRVIYSAGQIPFVVVQQRPLGDNGYKNIVLPFSFMAESRQKLAWAIYLNKIFHCTFHIFIDNESDEFISNKIRNNLQFAEKYLKKHDCNYTVQRAKESGDFRDQIVDFASSVFADMIIIMSEEDKEFSDIFSAPAEQNILANPAQIPVFCINAVDNMLIMEAAMFQ